MGAALEMLKILLAHFVPDPMCVAKAMLLDIWGLAHSLLVAGHSR